MISIPAFEFRLLPKACVHDFTFFVSHIVFLDAIYGRNLVLFA